MKRLGSTTQLSNGQKCKWSLACCMNPPGIQQDRAQSNRTRLLRCHFHSTAEYLVVHKSATTPIDLLAAFSLRRNGERNEPRSLAPLLEPTVGHHSLVVFPPAEFIEMFRHAEDVGFLIGPDFAVTSDGDILVDR